MRSRFLTSDQFSFFRIPKALFTEGIYYVERDNKKNLSDMEKNKARKEDKECWKGDEGMSVDYRKKCI